MIEKYYFLFFIACLWIVFATIYDLRKTEVPNWLNFSLILFALTYRSFYALRFDDYRFLLLGILGFGIFFVFANLFYYTRAFAGGDAKLLMGLGIILPAESYLGLFYNAISFIFILFLVGTIYSLIYSLFLVYKNKNKFGAEFARLFRRNKYIFYTVFLIYLVFLAFLDFVQWIYFLLFLFSINFLYIYLKALETCLIVKLNASKLTEGDWLEQDVRVGGRIIRKSVHGLSFNDIKLLKKYGKGVLVKQGIPFAPAFLFAFVIMVFSYLVLGQELYGWLISLFSEFFAF